MTRGDNPGLAAGLTVLVDGASTAGRLALLALTVARGQEPPRHRHHWEDEALYVVAGELAVHLGGAWRRVPAGAVIFLPRGVEHAVAAVTPEARVLTILTPAGFEGFHREWGAPAVGVAAPDLERLVALAARYGCEITGPAARPARYGRASGRYRGGRRLTAVRTGARLGRVRRPIAARAARRTPRYPTSRHGADS